jgi:hypothetical protein
MTRREQHVSLLDGAVVSRIGSALQIEISGSSRPVPLLANRQLAWIGSGPYGEGFILTPSQALGMIEEDPRNAEVVKPYLIGEDVNRSVDSSPQRWIIDFGRLSKVVAAEYRAPWEWVRQHVKPDRDRLDPVKYKRIVENWWEYWAPRFDLYEALLLSDGALVLARVSNTLVPVFTRASQVFSEQLVVLPYRPGLQALLSSSLHLTWANRHASSLRSDIRYTYVDVLWTMALPSDLPSLEVVSVQLREAQVQARERLTIGLTPLYKRVNDPGVNESEIETIRAAHRAVDEALLACYGWQDIELEHGFYEERGVRRYIASPTNQAQFLERLADLNRRRHLEELAAGLVDEKGTPLRTKAANVKRSKRHPKDVSPAAQDGLFEGLGTE